jgi:peroxiredoxin
LNKRSFLQPSWSAAAIAVVTGFALLDSRFTLARDEQNSKPPAIGDTVEDFELKTLKDEPVKLSDQLRRGPVVVIVLRGFPGYQCPVCNQQVGQFLAKADQFADAKATILLVYPGPAEDLNQHATDFLDDRSLPENVLFVTDPDYTFTNAWSLRWDAANETAYPATFVVDEKRVVRFAKISKSHGDRSKPDDVLKALKEMSGR